MILNPLLEAEGTKMGAKCFISSSGLTPTGSFLLEFSGMTRLLP